MAKSQVFIKNGFLCIVERDQNEITEHYYKRGWFIVSQQPSNIKEYNIAVTYSRIFLNKHLYDCLYNDKITIRLNEMIKNL